MRSIKTEVQAERTNFRRRIDLVVWHNPTAGKRCLGQPIIYTEVDEGQELKPTLSLHMEEAQLLMDELWNCGLRPTEGTGSAGSLAATERHLKDMQAITKGLLKKDGIEC